MDLIGLNQSTNLSVMWSDTICDLINALDVFIDIDKKVCSVQNQFFLKFR